jgi:hypothetical protein
MPSQVVVDGIPYYAQQTTPSIGIAITTLNRHEVLAETLAAVEKFTPAGVPVIVVDDGSTEPVSVPSWVTLVRHEVPQGIPAGKNRCLAELMRLGVEHLFLFDDDTRPADETWWERYAFAPEPHYSYCWTHFANGPKRAVPKMDVLYQDSRLVAYGWSMGCMLYAHADVVNDIGGMATEFGMGMEEHAEWSQRIHNAGHTSFVHQDIAGSAGLIYASDECGAVPRSFDWKDRAELLTRNEALRLARLGSTEYVEYRGHRDVVLTSYFTSVMDSQRGQHMTTNPKVLDPLISSVVGCGSSVIVLTDTEGIMGERVDAPLSAYQQRWLSEYQWLRDHPEVRYAALVDATDVVMLRNPFGELEPDTLYCGWEPKAVGDQWIRDHSPAVAGWIEEHRHEMLLNCGVALGDRKTLMTLCRSMVDMWVRDQGDPLHEMAYFNIAARQAPRLVTGPQITTLFKANVADDPVAWWKHK